MPYKNEADRKAGARKDYLKHADAYKARAKASIYEKIKYAKQAKEIPCADCGQTYPYYVMDFDHRDPTLKTANIQKICTSYGWATLKAEIAKCDVVCSNCHRERTWGVKQNHPSFGTGYQ